MKSTRRIAQRESDCTADVLKNHSVTFFLTLGKLGSRHAFVLCARHLYISRPERVGRAGRTPGSENFYPTHPPLKFEKRGEQLVITFQMNKFTAHWNWTCYKVQDRKFQKQLQTTEDLSCLKRRFQKSIFQKLRHRTRRRGRSTRKEEDGGSPPVSRFHKGSSLKWDAAYQTKAHLYLYGCVPDCALLTKQN